MMRTWIRNTLTTILVLAAGCSGVPGNRTEEADAALRAGNAERAYELYREARSARPNDPLLDEKIEVARKQAADAHLARARELAASGDYGGAREESRLAATWAPANEQVVGLPSEIDARESRDSTGIRDAVKRARQAAAAGRITDALRTIGQARASYGDRPELLAEQRSIAGDATRTLSDRAASALAAGRPALATLLYRAAAELTGSAPAGFARAREALADRLATDVAVGPFTEATGGVVSLAGFRSQVAGAIRKSGPEDLTRVRLAKAGDVLVSGRIASLTVRAGTPRTERRRIEYVVRVDRRENPARTLLQTRIQQLSADLARARSVDEAARKELASLERLEPSAAVHARGGRRYGPYSEAAYYRYLANARRRGALAGGTVDRIQAELDASKRQLATEPARIETPVKATTVAEITTLSRTAEVAVEFRISGAAGSSEGTARATTTATDEVRPALPGSGLPADPAELPDEHSLAVRVLDQAAGKVATAVSSRIAASKKGLLAEARRLQAEGRVDDALDRYATLLLATGDALPLERGAAADEVESLLGIRMEGSRLDVVNLGAR